MYLSHDGEASNYKQVICKSRIFFTSAVGNGTKNSRGDLILFIHRFLQSFVNRNNSSAEYKYTGSCEKIVLTLVFFTQTKFSGDEA